MMTLAFADIDLTLRGRQILKNLSGSIHPGRVTIILGANGAGKSSLLSCLAGLRMPDNGQVTMDGQPLAAMSPRLRARTIGLLPQTGTIHWDIDVRSLVGLGRLPHSGRWGMTETDRLAIEQAMKATDIIELANRTVTRLSGGEQGRVLLARVLAGEPRWLLADEPLANMDPAHQLDVLDRLKATAAQGTGVVVVLHDLTQAARIADDVIILKQGEILAAGAQDAILTPAILEQAYCVEVYEGMSADGQRLLVPIRRLT